MDCLSCQEQCMPETNLFLGIEIGGTKLQLATGTADGDIINSSCLSVAADGGAGAIRQQIKEVLHLLMRDPVAAIGVGFGGPVDYEKGIICTSHQVSGWANFPLAGWLQELTGLPVAVENDASTAALAEAILGHGRGHGRVFYMTIGSGIGGGLIINGEIYHGAVPGEAEIGHVRLTKNGETVEQCCSGWAVNQKVKEAIAQHPGGLLSTLAAQHRGPEAALLYPALQAKDAVAEEIIETVADDLAFALSHAVHLFHPDSIIIGGGLSLLQKYLLQPMNSKLLNYVMKAFLPPPEIKTAFLKEDAVPAGALLLAHKKWKQFNYAK